MADDNKFVDGLFVDAPHENAPDFVKCKLGIDRKKLGNWLRAQTDDRINIVVKQSKKGKWYASVDEWKPDPNKKSANKPAEAPDDMDGFDDFIPF